MATDRPLSTRDREAIRNNLGGRRLAEPGPAARAVLQQRQQAIFADPKFHDSRMAALHPDEHARLVAENLEIVATLHPEPEETP